VHHAITSTPYYGVLDKLETADKFKERMPTFKELAELFASSSDYTNVQLMLDVKRTNEPWVVSKVVEVLKEVNPDMTGFWAKRMALGIWREDVLAAAEKDAPELPIVFIGVSLRLARKFMHHKQVAGLSVHHASLNLPGGESLIKDARANGKLIYSWTVNSPAAMKWAVSANIDGIVTDHPDVYTRFIDGLTQKEIDTIYSASAPHSFFSWKELWVKFPLIYALAAFYFTLATLSNFILPQRKKI
jgi:phosphatidylglycerol phospholipase C